MSIDSHQKNFMKLIEKASRRHRKHEVFRDFCEVMAIALSNAVDKRQFEKRESRYFEILKKYEKEEFNLFPEMFAEVVNSLADKYHDCLGSIFMAMNLGDSWKGQFFTPYSISYMMAKMTFSGLEEKVKSKGYIELNEPTCGAGGMIIGMAQSMIDIGINYQEHLHVIAQDIDETAVHMTYIQLSILHIPAIVIHCNSLNPGKTWSDWSTPAHIIGGWKYRVGTNLVETISEIKVPLLMPAKMVNAMPEMGQLNLFS
ncbi:hypothetical protein JAB4_059540 (plasmid) [Janthinobacterium sp. HH102]|uniref:N-6 DNA methylase n=1 Tax=Janthinobacterium sp. HH102 TaxID=1537274 RepID=UPI000873D2EE|nr:N-6 DNA methylase [Janthinobacterium sp. HH102]QOU76454.1 hypothetical protein JAB4_059540 [Janthinobacterium sp. HH102]